MPHNLASMPTPQHTRLRDENLIRCLNLVQPLRLLLIIIANLQKSTWKAHFSLVPRVGETAQTTDRSDSYSRSAEETSSSPPPIWLLKQREASFQVFSRLAQLLREAICPQKTNRTCWGDVPDASQLQSEMRDQARGQFSLVASASFPWIAQGRGTIGMRRIDIYARPACPR
jgi:hypothetical protein